MTMNDQTKKKAAVWIADDSAAERELARRVLCDDYDVRSFADGEGLIEALSQEALPDAVVLDWVMPGISGIEACQYIRTNKATQRLPLLLLTSNDRPEDVAAGLDAGELFADSRRVRQVVFNLISNAIKFTPRGGKVRVALDYPERGSVRVVVKDTGVGVSELSRQQLFTRYTRGTGRAQEISGTGLGLMIVKEIIEAHEGSVGVDSVEGQGSSFWFRLPAAATAHRTSTA